MIMCCARDLFLKYKATNVWYQTSTKYNKSWTMCIIAEMYCILRKTSLCFKCILHRTFLISSQANHLSVYDYHVFHEFDSECQGWPPCTTSMKPGDAQIWQLNRQHRSGSWWRHQMETFSALLAFCVGWTLTKGNDAELWCFSLICTWINGWVNNGKAGDLRRHRAHYDITVMM